MVEVGVWECVYVIATFTGGGKDRVSYIFLLFGRRGTQVNVIKASVGVVELLWLLAGKAPEVTTTAPQELCGLAKGRTPRRQPHGRRLA
jgi:hypothetical protein